MEGEQYGEVDEFQMRHEDPSDFLECLTWHQAIAKSEGYENEEIIIVIMFLIQDYHEVNEQIINEYIKINNLKKIN